MGRHRVRETSRQGATNNSASPADSPATWQQGILQHHQHTNTPPMVRRQGECWDDAACWSRLTLEQQLMHHMMQGSSSPTPQPPPSCPSCTTQAQRLLLSVEGCSCRPLAKHQTTTSAMPMLLLSDSKPAQPILPWLRNAAAFHLLPSPAPFVRSQPTQPSCNMQHRTCKKLRYWEPALRCK